MTIDVFCVHRNARTWTYNGKQRNECPMCGEQWWGSIPPETVIGYIREEASHE